MGNQHIERNKESQSLLEPSLAYTINPDSLGRFEKYKFVSVICSFAVAHGHVESSFFYIQRGQSLHHKAALSWDTPLVKIYCDLTNPKIFYFKIISLEQWKE